MNKAFNYVQTSHFEWFALTLTVNEFHSRDKSLKTLFEWSLMDIAKRLDRFTIRWDAYPELQPKSGLLHWHICARVKGLQNKMKMSAFMNFWATHYGFYMIKPIKYDSINVEGWLRYCEKEWLEMQILLKLQRKMFDPCDHITQGSWKRFLTKSDDIVKYPHDEISFST